MYQETIGWSSSGRAALALACTVTAGCQDQASIVPPDDSGINRAFVTGAAAAALDADGRFALESAGTWARAELTESQAVVLTDYYARKLAPTLPSYFERSHGQPIDFAQLRQCGRVYYAASPYLEPPSSTPRALVNTLSPRWLVTYCDGNELPALSVSVASTATSLRLLEGSIDPASEVGMEFEADGIPAGAATPMAPERAVERLAQEARRRVATVPRLVLPGFPYVAATARWQLDLETPVEAHGGSGTRIERRFFVGWALREWRLETATGAPPVAGQSEHVILPSGERITFSRRPGEPRSFEAVSFGGGRP